MAENITPQQKMQITEDMIIQEIVEKHPSVATIFTGYGLHCVGCGAAGMESLGDGARGHGMDQEMINMMIRDANAIVEAENVAGDGLEITQKAAEQVSKFKENE